MLFNITTLDVDSSWQRVFISALGSLYRDSIVLDVDLDHRHNIINRVVARHRLPRKAHDQGDGVRAPPLLHGHAFDRPRLEHPVSRSDHGLTTLGPIA